MSNDNDKKIEEIISKRIPIGFDEGLYTRLCSDIQSYIKEIIQTKEALVYYLQKDLVAKNERIRNRDEEIKSLIKEAEQRVAREIFKELRLYERDNKIYMDKNAGWTFQYCLNSDQFLEYLEELRKKYNVESGEG